MNRGEGLIELKRISISVKKYLLIYLLICYPGFCISQNQEMLTDSLLKVLETLNSDTSNVNVLNNLSKCYRLNGNFTKSLSYAENALHLATKLNYKKGIVDAYYNKGYTYWNQGNYADGLKSQFSALNIGEEIHDRQIISDAFNNIGTNYFKQSNFIKDLKIYLLELKKIEISGDKQIIAYSYRHLANSYAMQGNYPEAVNYYLRSLKIDEQTGNLFGICLTYCNIGNVYLLLGQLAEARNSFEVSLEIAKRIKHKRSIAINYINLGDVYRIEGNFSEALKYKLTALSIAKEINDKYSVAAAYKDIGLIYFKLGNYSQALKNALASLSLAKEIENKELVASIYLFLGEINTFLNNFDQADEFLTNGLFIAKEIGNKEQIKNSYYDLSKFKKLQGDFEGAYNYQLLYETMKDSLLNTESDKQISYLKIQYETEKKDKEIALLNSENRIKTAELGKQKIIKYVVFSFSILIVSVIILVFNNIRIKNKSKQLSKDNEVRLRISRDLHDEIGSGLSRMALISQVIMKYQHNTQKLNENLLKMKTISQQLNQQMNEMIWKVNPAYDTIESMLGYMRQYAGELLEENNIEYEINFPEPLKDSKVSTDFRRTIFSITKEVLNNAVKHAHATLLKLAFILNKEGTFEYTITDNGNGFDIERTGLFKNGLKNISQRAEELGIKFELESEKGKGTHIVLHGEIKITT